MRLSRNTMQRLHLWIYIPILYSFSKTRLHATGTKLVLWTQQIVKWCDNRLKDTKDQESIYKVFPCFLHAAKLSDGDWRAPLSLLDTVCSSGAGSSMALHHALTDQRTTFTEFVITTHLVMNLVHCTNCLDPLRLTLEPLKTHKELRALIVAEKSVTIKIVFNTRDGRRLRS